MPRESNNVLKLMELFKTNKVVTPKEILEIAPASNFASVVWYLQHRKGMTIKVEKQAGKVVKYEYDATVPSPIIIGSKKAWETAQAIHAALDTPLKSADTENQSTETPSPRGE